MKWMLNWNIALNGTPVHSTVSKHDFETIYKVLKAIQLQNIQKSTIFTGQHL